MGWRHRIQQFLPPYRAICDDRMVLPCGISRSGTTLLATIFDSHSKISLGYELIPPKLGDASSVAAVLARVLEQAKGDFSQCGQILRKEGDKVLGQWLARCHRAGATADEVAGVLDELRLQKRGQVASFADRLRVAAMISARQGRRAGAVLHGFKFGSVRYRAGRRAFPQAWFVYIVRDPRDVVASQLSREFDSTVPEICDDWNTNLVEFERLASAHPQVCHLVRYEDLVENPNREIPRLFARLPLEIEPAVYHFYESKATIHASRHPNSDNLKQDFFTHSIGRWKTDLAAEVTRQVEALCARDMLRHGYEPIAAQGLSTPRRSTAERNEPAGPSRSAA